MSSWWPPRELSKRFGLPDIRLKYIDIKIAIICIDITLFCMKFDFSDRWETWNLTNDYGGKMESELPLNHTAGLYIGLPTVSSQPSCVGDQWFLNVKN